VAHAALLPALAIVFGIACGILFPAPGWFGLALLLAALGTAITAHCCRRSRAVVIAVACGFVAGGFTLASRAERLARDPPLAHLVGTHRAEEPVVLCGHLLEDAEPGPNGVSLALDVDELVRRGSSSATPRGTVLLTVVSAPAPLQLREWRAGRRICSPAWVRLPSVYLDPGVPDYRLQLARRGVALVGTIKSAALVDVTARGTPVDEMAAAIRAHVRRAISETVGSFAPRAAGIVIAVLIGDRSGLETKTERTLQEAGTYHVIAISGGNIAILAAVLLFIARACAVPWRAAHLGTAAILAIYAVVAGGGSSVARATVMGVVYLAARTIDQQASPLSALAIAAALILAGSPLSLVDPGFALTFGASLALVLIVPRLLAWRTVHWTLHAPLGLAAASLAVEAVLLPVGAAFFSRVTSAGLLLNFAAIPLMSIVQIGGMSVCILWELGLHASVTAARIPAWAADTLVSSGGLVSWMPWSTRRVPAPDWWIVVLYYAALALILTRRLWPWSIGRRPVWTRGASIVLVVTGFEIGTAPALRVRTAAGLLVTSIDVGQGDATLLQLPGEHAILVDAGGLGGASGFDIGERVVAPTLWALGVRRLDAVVVTHGDADHIGGAASIVQIFQPREIWEGVPIAGHAGLASVRAAARQVRAAWRTVQQGDRLAVGEATLTVLAPPLAAWERRRVRNDDSVVLEVRMGDVSFILPGDAGVAVEAAVAPLVAPAGVRIVKLGHHGSATASSAAFLSALHPRAAVVSCGRQNRFGHPAPAVMRRLTAADVRPFRTDQDGAITFRTDGRTVHVHTWTGEDATFSVPNSIVAAGTPSPRRKRQGLAAAVAAWLRRTQLARNDLTPPGPSQSRARKHENPRNHEPSFSIQH
jgi:competence protein ComEC